MHKHRVIFGVVFSLITAVLLLMVVPPALGLPPFQPEETQRAQTIEAFVNESVAQTQTAITADLYATADAMFQPTGTPTPFTGQDARAQYQAARHVSAGWELYYQSAHFAALEEFNTAIEISPGWAEGYVGRALTYIQLFQYNDALHDFDRAIELVPNDADLYGGQRAYVYGLLDDYTPIISDGTQALDLNPRHVDSLVNRGWAYAQTGRFDDAFKDFSKALRLEPGSSSPYYFRGSIYEIEGDWSLQVIYSTIYRALSAYEDGHPGDAMGELTRVVNNNAATLMTEAPETLTYIYYNLGRLHREFGNTDLALDAFQNALSYALDFGGAYTGLGDVHLDLGEVSTAFDYYDSAIRVEPDRATNYLARGRAYEAQQDHAAAAADYWKYIALMQGRNIVWDAYMPDQAFTVAIEKTWAYSIPFEGQAGQVVSLTVTPVADAWGEADPIVVLLDPDGEPIAGRSSIHNAIRMAALDDVILPADGAYTFVISHEEAFGGPVSIKVELGPVVSEAEQTATAESYTATPTNTPTLTPTATFTPSITPTPSTTPTPTATLAPEISDFGLLRQINEDFVKAAIWQDAETVITFNLYNIQRYDAKSGNLKSEWDDPLVMTPWTLAISPDRRWLAAPNETIYIVDLSNGDIVAELEGHSETVDTMAFSPNGQWLVSGGSTDNLIFWDLTTFESIAVVDAGHPKSIAISPDGQWMAVADSWYGVYLWDVSDPSNPRELYEIYNTPDLYYFNYGNFLAYSPDGTRLAVVDDPDIVILETENYTPVGRLRGHTGDIIALAFSPDGTLLVSGSEDQTVRIWHVDYAAELAVLGGPERFDKLEYVAFSPDGSKLVTLDDDNVALIWQRNLNLGVPEAGESSLPPLDEDTANLIKAAEETAWGWTYYLLDRDDESLAALNRAVNYAPYWGHPYVLRAVVKSFARDYQGSVDDFGTALALEGESTYVLGRRGLNLVFIRKLDQAFVDLQRAIEIKPESKNYSDLAYAHTRLQQYEEALPYAIKAIELSPTVDYYFADRSTLYNMLDEPTRSLLDGFMRDALAANDSGNLEEATRLFERVTNYPDAAEYPDPVKYAYWNLGYLYMYQPDYELAAEAFDNALEVDPEFTLAMAWRGGVYYNQDDYEEAIALYERVLELEPDAQFTHFMLALAYDRSDQHEAAVQEYYAWTQAYETRRIDWDFHVAGTSVPLVMNTGFVYYVPFVGEAGQTIHIQTEVLRDVSQGNDPVIVVLSPDGSVLAADNNSGTKQYEDMLDLTLAEDGEYTLIVTSGSYSGGLLRFDLNASGPRIVTPAAPPSPNP